MYAEGFKPSPWGATVYTHIGQGINVLRDPPKSPLKKGDFESGSPFFKGGFGGDQTQLRLDQKTCVYTVAPRRGTLKAFPAPLALWERGWG